MRHALFALLVSGLLLLAGCSKPIPAERSSYVGNWQSSAMFVLITQDGRVAYQRLINENSLKGIKGPLQSFEGNDFIVGVGPLKTKFTVSVPPHEEQGIWKMTVDGVELTRQ